jgi:hypothetical protein
MMMITDVARLEEVLNYALEHEHYPQKQTPKNNT